MAIFAFVWAYILTCEGMLFHWAKKLPEFITCPYCVGGQIALFFAIFDFKDFETVVFSPILTIFFIHILVILENKLND